MAGRVRQTVGQSLLGLCAALASASALAGSEDFFDLPPEHLSKLKITAASAFTESALDASATVSLVTRSDWERRGARNLPDAVMHLPGVMLLQPPAGGKLIQVRSYDSTSLRGRATLIDGVPINTFAFGSEVWSDAEMLLPVMDSLELVRGPSSILYGSDAFHSALLVSTYRNHLQDFQVSGEVGDKNYRQLALRGTQPLGDDHSLQMAVAAAHQGDQGYRYHYVTPDGEPASREREQSYDAFTGLLRWEGRGDTVSYHLQLFTDKSDAKEFPGGGRIGGDTRAYDTGDHNGELWMLKGAVQGELGGGWGWQWDNYYWRNDYGYSYYLPVPNTRLFFEDDQQLLEHRWGSRLRLTRTDLEFLSGKTQLALSGGVEEAEIDDHDNRRRLIIPVPVAQPALDYSGLDQSINSLALEGKTQWQDGRWQLIYGGRYDDYSTFGSELSPRLGLIWMPSTDYSIKVLYGEAFRAPNANELQGTNFAAPNVDLKPETLESLELAFTFSRGHWQTEVVGFKNRWHDRILLTENPLVPAGRYYTNRDESESKGLEATVAYVEERWRLELSGARINNRNLDTGVSTGVFPKWMVGLGAGYRWPAQRLELFWSNRVHENVNDGDKTFAVAPVKKAGTYFRSDLSLRQQWTDHWQGQLTLRNIFDRDNVWPSIVNSRGGVDDIPRQVSLEVEYRGLP